MQRELILLSLLAGVFIGTGVRLYTSRIVKPVVNLSLAAKKISDGDYSVSIPVYDGQDEIATLTRSLDDLVNTLVEQITRLKLSADRFHTMHQIDRATLDAKGIHEIAATCINFYKTHWDIAGANVVVIDEDTAEGRVVADYNANGPSLKNGTTISLNASLLDAIRSEFEQIDRQKQEQQGMGLGLPLAKAILEIHGGNIEFQRVASGGTKVILSLPLAVY